LKSHFVTATLKGHLCIAEPVRQTEKKFEPEEEKQTAEEVFHDTDDSIEGEEQVQEIYLTLFSRIFTGVEREL
jgi:hypothetical protein